MFNLKNIRPLPRQRIYKIYFLDFIKDFFLFNFKHGTKVKELEKLGIENTYILEKRFESMSSVRSKMTLDRVENVSEGTEGRIYYVYKRLSIKKYDELLTNRIHKAVQSALLDYQSGIELNDTDPMGAMGYFFSGYRNLVPYQDQILVVNNPNGANTTVNIDIELKAVLKEMINNFEFQAVQSDYIGKIGQPLDNKLTAIVQYRNGSDNNQSTDNVPIRFSFDTGDGDLVTTSLSGDGGKWCMTRQGHWFLWLEL